MQLNLPQCWLDAVGSELNEDYFKKLSAFVDQERRQQEVFPPEDEVFTAFQQTDYNDVKVLLLGQDPYHNDGQAHGLSFSVKRGVAPPPSLKNMYKELAVDIPGFRAPSHGCLLSWAKQGVMLLNAVLTVRAHEPASHSKKGWETFTDAVISKLNQRTRPLVFVLWGGYAKKKLNLIDSTRHGVVACAHPSPLSARLFLGSRPFSRVNSLLAAQGHSPIDWKL